MVVDSVNIVAYEIYERRSYGQVVVNGARVTLGLGKAEDHSGEGSNKCSYKVDVEIIAEQELGVGKEINENAIKHGAIVWGGYATSKYHGEAGVVV